MAAVNPPQPPVLLHRDQFTNVSSFKLGSMFFSYPDQNPRRDVTIAWCRENGMLATEMTCPNCGDRCREQNRNRCIDKVAWRCTNNDCRKVINIRKGSFFESSRLELWQIIGMSHTWASSAGKARGSSQANFMQDVCVTARVVVDWKQFFRDVCVSYFANNHEQIGGPGIIVEVDESLFTKRKYNVGRQREQRWVLGGYEQERKIGFMVEVPSRDAATLLPIIQHWVAPGSIIWTDRWAAYAQLPNIPGMQYVHQTVNHTANFVDPVTGACTNRVEAMWARAKAKFHASQGPTNPDLIADYLLEFMWNQRFGDSAFYHLWFQIVHQYRV